ncbi:MAG: serine hydrolase domain-containing protein [Hyphomonadaceae bacterium]
MTALPAQVSPLAGPRSAKPEALGLSSERLARLDRFLEERYIAPGKLPCALTMVLRRGELAHTSILGKQDVERNKPLQEDTLFRIYSMTKPITSIAMMMLIEEGKVSLDDPVHRLIPAWRNLGVYVAGRTGMWQTKRTDAPMRVIDLLRHTSGLTYGFQVHTNVDHAYRKAALDDPTANTIEEFIAKLAELPLEFSPGSAWNYSVSTDVLGYLVEKVSGQRFEDFLRDRIFKPLGMHDTFFHVPESEHKRFASCYTLLPGGKTVLQDDAEKSAYLAPKKMCSGGGGLVSTAADYLQFCRMLLNGGELNGHRIVSPKTIELMTKNHLPEGKELMEVSKSLFSEAIYAGVGFGLGFAMTTDLARTQNMGTLGEYWWGGMASTAFWVDPKEDLTVVFMTQLMPSHSYPIRRELRTLIYSALTESNV